MRCIPIAFLERPVLLHVGENDIAIPGKTPKYSDKAIRAAKRRNSGGHPVLSAKRNKKAPY